MQLMPTCQVSAFAIGSMCQYIKTLTTNHLSIKLAIIITFSNKRYRKYEKLFSSPRANLKLDRLFSNRSRFLWPRKVSKFSSSSGIWWVRVSSNSILNRQICWKKDKSVTYRIPMQSVFGDGGDGNEDQIRDTKFKTTTRNACLATTQWQMIVTNSFLSIINWKPVRGRHCLLIKTCHAHYESIEIEKLAAFCANGVNVSRILWIDIDESMLIGFENRPNQFGFFCLILGC